MDNHTTSLPHLPAVAETPAVTGAPPARGRRIWYSAGVAAAGGALLAASVAVPVTWALTDGDAVAVSGGAVAPAYQGAAFPGSLPGTSPGLGDGLDEGVGDSTETGPQDRSVADSGAAATEAQSQGVVLIETTTASGAGAGTGIVLTSDGLVITNYHVVEDAAEVTVTVATTAESFTAEVVGFDETADVALLELDGAEGLTVAVLDDDGDAVDPDGEAGDEVTAVGNAGGQGYLSAVDGTVTATDRTITTSDGYGMPGSAEQLTGLLQTTAAAVPGYSGGPTLDAEGEVLGLTTAASSAAAESFAVPIEDVLDVIEQIRAGDESGSVQVGASAYLGVTVSESGSGVGSAAGVAVAEVEAGTPAAEAGLAAGDVITEAGGRVVARVEELTDLLGQREPGDRVALTWTTSAGKQRTAVVTLAESPYA
ncbi:S1C family serine protease [Nocardioides ferulae]|uniref:S1C family serine protease n=1 Tax=Nocardioides ferulae TaxID=2340821 RepID=UPI000EB57B4B|nr:trypsin-like peptidase domain-containing protein [Nocardioides ferulae]